MNQYRSQIRFHNIVNLKLLLGKFLALKTCVLPENKEDQNYL